MACERSLWPLTDCLWYLPCIVFVPAIGFGLRIAMTAAGCREKGFLGMYFNYSFIFLHCLLYFFPKNELNLSLELRMWKLEESDNWIYSQHGKFRVKGFSFCLKMPGEGVTLFAELWNIRRIFELLKGSHLSSRRIARAWASLSAGAWENTVQGMCHLLRPDNWHPSEMAWHYLSIKLESV